MDASFESLVQSSSCLVQVPVVRVSFSGERDKLVCLSIASQQPAFNNWIWTLRPACVGISALPQKLHLYFTMMKGVHRGKWICKDLLSATIWPKVLSSISVHYSCSWHFYLVAWGCFGPGELVHQVTRLCHWCALVCLYVWSINKYISLVSTIFPFFVSHHWPSLTRDS